MLYESQLDQSLPSAELEISLPGFSFKLGLQMVGSPKSGECLSAERGYLSQMQSVDTLIHLFLRQQNQSLLWFFFPIKWDSNTFP